MATRFYMCFGQDPPEVSPAIAANWDLEAANALRQPLSTTVPAVTNAAGIYIFSCTESSAEIVDIMCGQFVSDPLSRENHAGPVTGIWSPRQSVSTYDMGTQLVIRVVSFDGLIERGVLFPARTYTTTSGTAGAINREFVTSTTRETRFLPGGSSELDEIYVWEGDRIVVEIGVRATNTTATSRFVDPRLQLRTDFTDGTLTEGTTGTNFNHWIEIYTDASFVENFRVDRSVGWGMSLDQEPV